MGPYDNSTRRYEDLPGYMEGHWYRREDGLIYIVPNAVAEIEGPDDEIEERLNTIYRASDVFEALDPYQVAEDLGLEVVPYTFRRHNPEWGYYVV